MTYVSEMRQLFQKRETFEIKRKKYKTETSISVYNFLSSSVKLKTGRVFHEIARRCFASPAERFSIAVVVSGQKFDPATRSITPLIRQIAFSAGVHVGATRRNISELFPGIFRGPARARALRLCRAGTYFRMREGKRIRPL